jgi:hypothetical protein
MIAAILGQRGEPGTGHHDGGRGDQPKVEQVSQGGEGGLAHADIIGMDDGQAIRVRETEFFQQGIVSRVSSEL